MKNFIYLAIFLVVLASFLLYQSALPGNQERVEITSVQLASIVDPNTGELQDEITDFNCEDNNVYCSFLLTNYSQNKRLKAFLVLQETDEGYYPNEVITEKTVPIYYGIQQKVSLQFKKPYEQWVGGKYYIILYSGEEPIASIPFNII